MPIDFKQQQSPLQGGKKRVGKQQPQQLNKHHRKIKPKGSPTIWARKLVQAVNGQTEEQNSFISPWLLVESTTYDSPHTAVLTYSSPWSKSLSDPRPTPLKNASFTVAWKIEKCLSSALLICRENSGISRPTKVS